MPVYVVGDLSAAEFEALKAYWESTSQEIHITDGEMDFSGGFDTLRLAAEPDDASRMVSAFEAVGVEPKVQDQGGYACSPCADCGKYGRDSYMSQDPNGDFICETCFDDKCFNCPSSGDVCWIDDGMESPSGELYSPAAWNEHCCDCESCDTVIWADDSFTSERTDQTLCASCYEGERGEEFTGVSKTFSADNTFGTSRSFGVELESDVGCGSQSFAFDAKEDGSIDGLEYVSHVLRGDAGLMEIKNFLDASQSLEADSACGFHLHVNMNDLNDAQRYAVFVAYTVTQDVWLSNVNGSRDGNSYSRRLERDALHDIYYAWEYGQSFMSFCGHRDRYYWMNVSAFATHGTFENRLHHGTFDFREVQKWVVANLRFVKAMIQDVTRPANEEEKAALQAKARAAVAEAFEFAATYNVGDTNAVSSMA